MAILKPASGLELAGKPGNRTPVLIGTMVVAAMIVAGCAVSLNPGELPRLRALDRIHQTRLDDQIHTYEPEFLTGPDGPGFMEKQP